MKITDAAVTMTSSSLLREEEIREESLLFWVGDQRPGLRDNPLPPITEELKDVVTISTEALAKQSQATAAAPEEEVVKDSIAEEPRLRAMRLILEALTGKKIRIANLDDLKTDSCTGPDDVSRHAADDGQPVREGWGLEYDYHESHSEYEEMNFSAGGSIRTEDGREIDFSLQLVMTREFFESTDIRIRGGDAKLVDPLVINFSGQAAELNNMKFSFDLDADGKEDQISFVGPGSGFLVLDHNNDQVVNDGSELFGPGSGDGFAELARYDSDHNGWVDENDPIFAKLKIWAKDAAGNDYLRSLLDHNIGAIFLESLQSDFHFKNHGNDLLGMVQKTSIFIREDGVAGTIQEIDLAV